MRSRSRTLVTAGVAVVVLALPGAASAAFDVTAFEVTPSTTAAGAHADVTIATSFTPYSPSAPPQRPRNVTFHLPPGLAGDPFSTPRCGEADYRADACAAATRVGSVAATATAVIVAPLVTLKQNVTGDLYNLAPAGAEPARLGAVLRPTGGLLGKLFVPTTITARASDGGLDSVVTNLPRDLNGIQLYTERMAFTLQGRPAGARGPFMRNPTSCKPATSTVEATPYDQPATTVKRTSSFTPRACGALAFEPHIDGAIGARGLTARRTKPPVHTVVTQGPEQAGQSAVTVVLPPVVGADLTQLGRACQAPQVLTRSCPATARIGSVTAATPLLAKPLTGRVYLAARLGQLPGLAIQLDDPIPLRLEGAVALTQAGIRTTFTGLPDVPLSRFALDLDGGPKGAFQIGQDLCALAAPPRVTATFVAQSGRQRAESKPMRVEGCTPAPAVSARITRLRTGRPTVRITATAAAGAPELRGLRVVLPEALRVKPKRARAGGAHARTGAGRVARSAVELSRDGVLRVMLPGATRTVTATLAKGAVRVGRKLKRARKPRRQRLVVLVTDAHDQRPPVTLKVRPRRR
jgi:hypothetical protein